MEETLTSGLLKFELLSTWRAYVRGLPVSEERWLQDRVGVGMVEL